MTLKLPTAVLRSVVNAISAEHGVPVSEIMNRRDRRAPVAHARQAVFYRLRGFRLSDGSYRYGVTEIGRAFGMDHSTVVWGVQRHIGRMAAEDTQVAA